MAPSFMCRRSKILFASLALASSHIVASATQHSLRGHTNEIQNGGEEELSPERQLSQDEEAGDSSGYPKLPVEISRQASAYVDNDDVKPRIVGGSSAEYIPWFALIMEEKGDEHVRGPCAAAMISRKWAVTAAHCISNYRKDDMSHQLDVLYIGAYRPFDKTGDKRKGNGGRPMEVIKIKRYVENPFHKPGSATPHDIALLELETEVTLRDFYPVELTTPNFEAKLRTGERGTIYGMGQTYTGGPLGTSLNSVQVGYVPPAMCQKLMNRWDITEDMTCFGGEGIGDSCGGDSGGPLLVDGKLTGVVSWGFRCAEVGYPGVYSSISYHLDWILSLVFPWEQPAALNAQSIKPPLSRSPPLPKLSLMPTSKPTKAPTRSRSSIQGKLTWYRTPTAPLPTVPVTSWYYQGSGKQPSPPATASTIRTTWYHAPLPTTVPMAIPTTAPTAGYISDDVSHLGSFQFQLAADTARCTTRVEFENGGQRRERSCGDISKNVDKFCELPLWDGPGKVWDVCCSACTVQRNRGGR